MTDTHADRLNAVRERLEAAIADAGARDLAPLSREYRQLLAEIADLHTPNREADRVDQLARRRAAKAPETTAG